MSTNINPIQKNDNLVLLTWEIDNFITREDGVIKCYSTIVGKKSHTDALAKYVSTHLVSECSSDSYSIPAARRMAILNVRGEKCFIQEKVVQLGTERANVCNC